MRFLLLGAITLLLAGCSWQPTTPDDYFNEEGFIDSYATSAHLDFAIASAVKNGERGLYKIAYATGELSPLRLEADFHLHDPSLSPDGRSVAYVRTKYSQQGDCFSAASSLAIMDLVNGTIKEGPQSESEIFFLQWSKDGARLHMVVQHPHCAFSTRAPSRLAYAPAGNLEPIRELEVQYYDAGFGLFENGTILIGKLEARGTQVWLQPSIYKMESAQEFPVPTNWSSLQGIGGGVPLGPICLSPSGRYMTFLSSPNGFDPTSIYTMNLETGNIRFLTGPHPAVARACFDEMQDGGSLFYLQNYVFSRQDELWRWTEGQGSKRIM